MPIEISFDSKTGEKTIFLPKIFKASTSDPEALKDVLKAMQSINLSANKYSTPLHIDMSNVTSLNAGAALLLFSFITSAQLVNQRGDFVRITLPTDTDLKKRIRSSGLWDAVRNGTGRKLDKNWNTDNNFQSGYDPEKHLELTLELLERKWGQLPPHLSVAINEAMLNISQHAYVTNNPNAVKRWWQYIFIRNNELHFLIFDKGIGIPDSFRLQNLHNRLNDRKIIELAMQRWVSSTGTKGRGNGSMNIQKPVSKVEHDTLIILSHSGAYEYYKDGKTKLIQLPLKLAGTLLMWKIGVQDD